MTDRVKGFTVVLDRDIRDDDAEPLRQAILMLRGVIDVANVLAGADDFINRTRVEFELRERIWRALETKEK